MALKHSNYYYKFHDDIEDRIDFRFNHPIFDSRLALVYRYGTRMGDDLITFIGNGSTPSKLPNDNSPESEKVLFIKNENVKPLFLDLDEKYYIFRHNYETSHKDLHVKKNDILLSMTGTLGNACLVSEDIEATINQNVVILRFNTDKVELEYGVRFLNSRFIEFQVKRNFTSGLTPYLNEDKIKNLKVIVLPKTSQKKIVKSVVSIESQANALESKVVDSFAFINKIFSDELGIELPRDMKTDYFFKEGSQKNSDYYQKFIGEVGNRFHYMFNHPKLGILDKLKEKYRTVPLQSICKNPIRRGEQPAYAESGVIVIKTVDLKNLFIDYKSNCKVSEGFYRSKPNAHIQKNDILVSSTGYGSVGKIDVFDIDEPALADGHISILRVSKDYDPWFVCYFLRSVLGQVQFEKWFTGSSGQIEVQPEDLGQFVFPSSVDISLIRQKEITAKISKKLNESMELQKKADEKHEEAKKTFCSLLIKELN